MPEPVRKMQLLAKRSPGKTVPARAKTVFAHRFIHVFPPVPHVFIDRQFLKSSVISASSSCVGTNASFAPPRNRRIVRCCVAMVIGGQTCVIAMHIISIFCDATKSNVVQSNSQPFAYFCTKNHSRVSRDMRTTATLPRSCDRLVRHFPDNPHFAGTSPY